jgi:acetyl-CoA carboxylase biotin carboxyl carrier protein
MAVPRRPRPVSKEDSGAHEGQSVNPFDPDQLQQICEMMDKHGLTELSLRNGPIQMKMRRGGNDLPPAGYVPAPAYTPPPSVAASAPPEKTASAASAGDEGLLVIKSPTVGTFYPSPAEGEPPFVNIGSKVTPKTVVCLIEAMKVFNQIPADVAGTIAAVLVKHGEAVEFGQPLFKVRP